MKKKLCLFIALLALAIVICRYRTQGQAMNELLLENIEALAEYESEEHVRCFGVGSVDCPRYHVKVDWVMSGYSLE